jgi:hypothetical protein
VSQTQLSAVERDGHWTVRIKWPNGPLHYFGSYTTRGEAEKWIADHRWMTAKRIEESDIPIVGKGKKGRPQKRA